MYSIIFIYGIPLLFILLGVFFWFIFKSKIQNKEKTVTSIQKLVFPIFLTIIFCNFIHTFIDVYGDAIAEKLTMSKIMIADSICLYPILIIAVFVLCLRIFKKK